MARTIARKTKEEKVPINRVQPLTEVSAKKLEEVLVSPQENGREIVHPKLEIFEYSTATSRGGLTEEDAIKMLGWETEPEYTKRMMEKYPNTKVQDYLFYEDYHCLDTYGEKVRCHKNVNNRPFDHEWSEKMEEMLLNGLWAGPLTYPGETVNGETIRISRYDEILSAQHQLTALKRANEKLRRSRDPNPEINDKNPHYDPNDPSTELYPFWAGKKEVVLETIVVVGVSDREEILRTIDYVRQRTLADMLYTMPLYRKNNPVERKEMTRMLANAVELLWTRTAAQGYRTHPEYQNFLERHMTLLQCVEHLFLENKPVIIGKIVKGDDETDEQFEERKKRLQASGGRRISKLRLSAGQCAALMYLMACSATEDVDDGYFDVSSGPPNEKDLSWDMMERARIFWTKLAGCRTFVPVRAKIAQLVESDKDNEDPDKIGLGGRTEEKFAVIAKAWDIFKDHPLDDPENPPFPYDIDPDTHDLVCEDLQPGGALMLSYKFSEVDDQGRPLPDSKVTLSDDDMADFQGIDCPDEAKNKNKSKGKGKKKKDKEPKASKSEPPSKPISPEEVEARKALIRAENMKKLEEETKKQSERDKPKKIRRK